MKTFTLTLVSFFVFTLSTYAQTPELWGLASNGGTFGGGTIYKMHADASNFSVMHNFQSPAGWLPVGKLMMAWDGKFYGACYEGGSFASCTIFRYDPQTLQYEDVWDFDIINGDFPRSGLLQGPAGVLYGVVPFGGYYSSGVIYSYNITTDTYTNLHDFNMSPNFGAGGWALPVIVNNDILYGTTIGGGSNAAGTLWKYNINTSQYTQQAEFNALLNGSEPYGGLIEASDGKLYGMCRNGGANTAGTLYSYDLISNTLTSLHDFDSLNGASPYGGLFEYTPGVLYGMTYFGGTNNYGTIFKYTIASNTFQKVHDFDLINGGFPTGELSADPVSGLLTGVADAGGLHGPGAYFTFDPFTNNYSKLYDFDGTTGGNPTGGVVSFFPTSITENTSTGHFLLYPNPAGDNINIHYSGTVKKDVTFSVKNMLGEVVMQWKEEEMTELYNRTISVHNLPGGIYMMESSSTDVSSVQLFVKQ